MSFQKKYRPRRKPITEMNLVPYIDVMLVLLLIFMITAPLLTQGVQVNLPQASAKAMPPQKNKPIIVSVNSQGTLFLNTSNNPDQPVTPQDLLSDVSTQLTTAQTEHKEQDVYVKGDRDANYGSIMKAMVLLQKAGAQGVGLITQSPSNTQS
ncbi:MAG: protein TolR [uncultured bacterium]|nr:MAG: protein TolR [uncultured bacterium]OGT32979.1 MAG: protein TolR [Gammaproteobacteria bacterium RIFCSPHIGHO2_02_FULL_39_13]OGT49757.1 MAG: protein TolR [Gammaproteobacteria bacterium RIFCSPHIGHO2_12_FULL_39_24]